MDELERRVEKYQLENIKELELLSIQEENKIESPVLEKVVDLVPSRLCECMKMKRDPIKY
jgi:hypothetical protein